MLHVVGGARELTTSGLLVQVLCSSFLLPAAAMPKARQNQTPELIMGDCFTRG